MCEKGGGMGGFGGATGNSLPPNPSQIKHILADRPGHLPDTPRNRQTLVEVANDAGCYVGRDANGVDWYARMEPDGSQTWVKVLGGVIRNGGRNKPPRQYDPTTGFDRNPERRKKHGR